MRQYFLFLFLFFSAIASGQNIAWIPFYWTADSISGKYFDKLSINIPVTLDSIPNKFTMQLDLGATTTVIYGNSIKPYLEKFIELQHKIDTNLNFRIQDQKNVMFKKVNLKLGTGFTINHNIGYYKNFGDSISKDSMNSITEKHIGTIAPDIFQDKILIIDYPNKRICILEVFPKQFSQANFRPLLLKRGRIKIPLTINGKEEKLLFDTGSSLFALLTTEDRANHISNKKIVDSLKISSWGEFYMVYGCNVKSSIKFGKKYLKPASVFYDKHNKLDKFYIEEGIWGITGNAFFFKNTVIVDYKNKRFGII